MAKKNKIQDDLDFDDDLDFGDFDDLSFGEPEAPKPKNKREAISQSLSQASKGFKASVVDNKLETIGKIASASVPSQLSSEVADLRDMYGTFKETMVKGIADVKKSGKSAADALAKLAPQNGKIQDMLKKISAKLDDGFKQDKGPSKEQLEQQALQAGILEALGELKTKEQSDTLVKEAMESKRHATSTQLLQNIYGELNFQRTFHNKVTAGYYRKSLELQYKSYFVQKTQLELLVGQLGTFKNQFETIILNTSLPDFIKARSTELLKQQFMHRGREELIGSFYKKFNPLGNIKKNMNNMLQNMMSGISSGLQGVSDAVDMAEGMDMSDMGITKSYMAGQMAADFAKSGAGWLIGRALGRTNRGKKAIYNVKNAMADPTGVMREIAKNNKDSKTLFGKFKYGIANTINALAGSPQQERVGYARENLDDAKVFDNRAHSAIVKVIPGLLTKIYGEIKTQRVGGKPEDNEIYFNNKNDRFMSKTEIIKDIKSDVKTALNNNSKYYIVRLMDAYKQAGVSVPRNKTDIFSRAVLKYMLNHRSNINPSMLGSEDFLNGIEDYKLRSSLTRASKKLIKAMQEDSYLADDVIYALSGLRTSIPNINSRFQDLHKSGMGDMLTTMGVAKYNSTTGNYAHDDAGNAAFILNQFDASSEYSPKVKKTQRDYIQQHIHDARERINKTVNKVKTRVNNAVDKTIDTGINTARQTINAARNYDYRNAPQDLRAKGARVAEAIRTMDKETLTDYVASTKSKVEDIIAAGSNKIPNSVKQKANREFRKVKARTKRFKQKTKKIYNQNMPKPVRDKIKEINNEVNEVVEEYVTTLREKGPSAVNALKTEERLKSVEKKLDTAINKAQNVNPNQVLNDIKLNKNDIGGNVATVATNVGNQITNKAIELKANVDKEVTEATKKRKKKKKQKQALEAKQEKDAKSGNPETAFNNDPEAVEVEMDALKEMYYESEEFKSGKITSFVEYCRTMGFKPKVNMTVKELFKKARQKDRELWWAAMKKIPKTPGAVFKGIKNLTKLSFKHVVNPTLSTALDMLPMGMGTGIKFLGNMMIAPIQLTAKAIETIKGGSEEDKAKEAKEAEKNRKGGWMSRLNIFKKDKDLNKDKNFVKRSANFLKENKGFTITAGIMGISMLLKSMGFSMQDAVSAIKTVGSGIMSFAKGVGKALSFIPGIGGLFGKTVETKDENGNIERKKESSLLGTAVGLGAAAYAVRHPIKTIKFGAKVVTWGASLISGIINIFRNKGGIRDRIVAWFLDKFRSTAEKIAEKSKNMKAAFSKMKRLFTNPKVAKKVGEKALKKAAVKVGTALTAAASGLGAILTAGMLLWELGWIFYYMWKKDMSFFQAACYQLLGWDIRDKESQDIIEGKETKEEQEQKQQDKTMNIEKDKKETVNVAKESSAPNNIVKVANTTTANTTSLAANKPDMDGQYPPRPVPKNDYPRYTDSPYIKPLMQSSGGLADVKNINKDLKARLEGYAEDYYNRTGKKLEITSGKRSLAQQRALWKQYYGFEATVPKSNSEADVKAARDADYARLRSMGKQSGRVAWPSPIAPHVKGEAIDLNVSAMPNQGSITADKRDPVLDPMLGKWGMVRTQTPFYRASIGEPGWKGVKERWHVQMSGGKLPSIDERPPEASKAPSEERRNYVEPANIVKVSSTSSSSSSTSNLPTVSSSTSARTTAPARTLTYSSPEPTQRLSGTNNAEGIRALSTLNDILNKSLQVQTASSGYLKEIRDVVVELAGKQAKPTEQATSLPEPAIDLRRREDFSTINI